MKYIVSIIVLFISFSSFSQQRRSERFVMDDSLKVNKTLVIPFDTLATAPLNSIAVKAGIFYVKTSFGWKEIEGEMADYIAVTKLTDRNAIPVERRKIGMEVYVADSAKSYRLIGGILDANWQEVVMGGNADGNNYPTNLTADAGTITLSRSGLAALSANITNLPQSSVSKLSDSLLSRYTKMQADGRFEPVISIKNSAFNRPFGWGANQVAEGIKTVNLDSQQTVNNKWLKSSFIAIPGESGDWSITGLWDRNKLNNLYYKGNIAVKLTGAGTLSSEMSDSRINGLVGTDKPFVKVADGLDSTSRIEIIFNKATPNGNREFQPFFASRYKDYCFDSIAVQWSADSVNWVSVPDWVVTNYSSLNNPSVWLPKSANTEYSQKYIKFIFSKYKTSNPSKSYFFVTQMGLRQQNDDYAPQFLRATGGDVLGDLNFKNRVNSAGNFATFLSSTGRLSERTPAQVLADIAAAPLNSPYFTGAPRFTFDPASYMSITPDANANVTFDLSKVGGKFIFNKPVQLTSGNFKTVGGQSIIGTGDIPTGTGGLPGIQDSLNARYTKPQSDSRYIQIANIGDGLYIDVDSRLKATACVPQWGDLNGNIMNQIDLQNALAGKEPAIPSLGAGFMLGQNKQPVPYADVLSSFNYNYPILIDDSLNNSISLTIKNIGNTDTTGITGGNYFYNNSTTGTKPAVSGTGQITLIVSDPTGRNLHTGGNNATMIFYDKSSGGVFLRRFDGSSHTWGGFDTLLNSTLGNLNYVNLKTGGTFTTDKASIGFPNYSGAFPQPSTSNGIIIGANGGMFAVSTNTSKINISQTNVTGTKQYDLPNKSGEITVGGNDFNTASNLVKLDADGKLPALDGSKLINLPGGGGGGTTDTTKLPLLNGGEIRGSDAKIVFHNNTNAWTPISGKNALMFKNNNLVIGHQGGTVTMMAGNTSGNQVWVSDNNGGGSLVVVPTVVADGYIKRNSTNTEWITSTDPLQSAESDYEDIPETSFDLSAATQPGATTPAPNLTGTYEGYKIAGTWVQVDFLITASAQGAAVTELTFPFPTGLPTPNIPSTLTGNNKIIKFAEIGAAATGVNNEPLASSRAYLVRNSNDTGFLVTIKSNAGAAAVWRVSLKYKIQQAIP